MINETFVLGGKAIFTVSNDSGEHLTFRVNGKKDRQDETKKVYFVSLLTGPDNLSSYTYMGMLKREELKLFLTRGSKFSNETKSVRVFRWAMQIINGKTDLPEGYKMQHAGRCCRCAKTLTDPDSIELGIGPECRKKMGIEV
jgi:hypothetical protein